MLQALSSRSCYDVAHRIKSESGPRHANLLPFPVLLVTRLQQILQRSLQTAVSTAWDNWLRPLQRRIGRWRTSSPGQLCLQDYLISLYRISIRDGVMEGAFAAAVHLQKERASHSQSAANVHP